MRNKLGFLVGLSLKKKIKSKWFIIANIVLALIIVGVMNIDSIITLFGGDFDTKTPVYVLDETNLIREDFKTNLNYYEQTLYGDDNVFEIKDTDKNKEDLIELVKTEETDAIIVEFYYDNEDMKAKLISLSTIDTYDYQLIVSAIKNASSMYELNRLGMSEEEYLRIINGIDVEREIIDETITSDDENMKMIMTTVFPAIILPFFMLTILLIQFIGSEINDEKSTKSMEIIVSSVSPKTHFLAKIISNNVFIIIQVILMFIYAFIAFKVRSLVGGSAITNGVGAEVSNIVNNLKSSVFNGKLVPVILLSLVLMILTFIAYSFIAGILASMTTNAEDYQHVQTPLVFTLLIGYYLATMAGIFEGATFIKVLSFVPLISAILSPSLLVLGQIGVLEVLLSICIMVIFIWLLVRYGMRIYKEGILNYSSTNIWKKIFKSLRNKN